MTKLKWFLVIILYSFILIKNISTDVSVDASEYNAFSEVTLESGKLLTNYTNSDYEKYYDEVDDNIFMGWKTNVINKEVKANFIEKTILEVTNETKDPITYNYNVTTSIETRTILDCSGSISYQVKGKIKEFTNDLGAKISISYKSENTEVKKVTEELKIVVDAGSKLLITLKGNGVVTNGVAAFYICWFENKIGGFEYFTITHEFQSIEKVKIT